MQDIHGGCLLVTKNAIKTFLGIILRFGQLTNTDLDLYNF